MDQRRVDSIRRQRSDPENHLIDEFLASRFSRREFVHRASLLGMSMPAIGAFLAACTNQTTSVQGKNVTLTLWIYGSDSEEGVTAKAMMPMFEQENPNIKVNWTLIGWEVAREKVLTGGASGTLPDVFEEWISNIPAFADVGLYAPLDGLVDQSQYTPVGLRGAQWKGHLYALPSLMNARVLNFRKDFLTAAGIQSPPQTWDDLRAAAVAMTKRDSHGNIQVVGFHVPSHHAYNTVEVWLPFVWSNGGKLFSTNGRQAAFNSDAGVEATTFLRDLLVRDKVDSPGAIQNEYLDFGQGRLASAITNGGVRTWKSAFPDLVKAGEPGFLAIPHNSGHTSVTEFGSEYFMMSATSQHKTESVKLLEFLTGPYALARASGSNGSSYVPGRLSPERTAFLKTDPYAGQYASIIDKSGRPDPRHTAWPQINDTLSAALDGIYLGGVDPKTGLNNAADQVNAIMSQSSPGAEG